MHRRTLLALGFASLAGCVQTPGTPPEAGIQLFNVGRFSLPIGTDPVGTSVMVSASYLADPGSRLAGRPALAAQTVAQYEFATVALNDPRFVGLSPLTQPMMARGRTALREAIGIRPDAPPPVVIEGLTQVAGALQRDDRAAAEAAMARIPLTRPPGQALEVFSAFPFVREANHASAFALMELNRPGSRMFWPG